MPLPNTWNGAAASGPRQLGLIAAARTVSPGGNPRAGIPHWAPRTGASPGAGRGSPGRAPGTARAGRGGAFPGAASACAGRRGGGSGRMLSPRERGADLARFYTVTEPRRHPRGHTVYKVTARVSRRPPPGPCPRRSPRPACPALPPVGL